MRRMSKAICAWLCFRLRYCATNSWAGKAAHCASRAPPAPQ